jgi:Lamin Tail Domain/CotH kinase protein
MTPAFIDQDSIVCAHVSTTRWLAVHWPLRLKRVCAILLALLSLQSATALADSVVVFNEVMYHPATNEAAMEWLELHNQNAVDVDLGGWRLTGGIDFEFPDTTVIRGGGFLIVAVSPSTLMSATGVTNVLGPFLGRLSNNGEEIRLRDRNNRLMDSLNYGVDGEWPEGADGAGVSLAKRHPNLASGPAENWTISRQVGGSPGAANFPIAAASVVTVSTNLTLIPFSASWRYYQSGDPGAGWNQPAFNDAAWGTGLALLGVETNALPLLLLTSLNLGESTYYFRTAFQFTGNPSGADLRIQHAVDDGVVVYLNGVEVLRTGMADGPVTHATLAARGVGDAVIEGPFPISSASLLSGTNVLAVEVHQAAISSSDIVFGLQLNEQRTLAVVTNSSGVPPLIGATTNVVPLAATWLYNDTGIDLGSAWRQLAYNDSAWGSGPALFFVEDAPLPGPKNTPLVPGRNTYYFRTIFPFDGDPAMKQFRFRALVDDGAVFYLNGAEIGRVNMPTGAVSYATMASIVVSDATFSGSFSIASSNLVVGQNILAVELHQSSATTNLGLRVTSAGAFTAAWDGGDGDFSTAASPAPAPTNSARASLGVDVFTSSNTNLAANLNDGRYGTGSAWSPATNDANPTVVLRFNQTIPVSSIAWSRDNGDATDTACGGTCTDRTLGNYTFQYTLNTNPAAITANSSNPTNGWTTIATVQYLSAQPGFTPHLRHRFNFAATNGLPIFATGIRLRPATTITLDEVEINPPAIGNFDAVFGLELTATDLLPPPPKLAFNEISGASSNAFWLEIINYGDIPVELGGIEIVRGGAIFAFPAQTLASGGIVSLAQAQLGFSAADGDKIFLRAFGGFAVLDAVTVKISARGRQPSGTGDWLVPASPTPGAANIFMLRNDVVINEIMYHAPPFDPVPAVTSNVNVVPISGTWRYNDMGVDLGTAWQAPGYLDSGWSVGAGLLAFNTGSLPSATNTTLAPNRSTYYFRKSFNFSGATSNVTLDVRAVVDDGAIYYLNGVEIFRQGMPAGPVTYSTSALSPVGNAGYSNPILVPASSLVQGVNVLAVEVHQASSAVSAGITLTGGGLALVEEGPFGGTPPMNLARQPGSAPFVIDSLSGFPIHNFVNLNDGVYGNNNSWIGNSGAPGYAGIRFAATNTITSIAFGRDNTGGFADRTLGTYTLQYTRVAVPGVGTTFTGNADTGWATIGTLNYQSAGSGYFTAPERRHRFTFTPVTVTGIRLLVPATGIGGGTCIDEIEVNPPDTTGDIAFGAEISLTTTLSPASPYQKSGEEWVELFNRSMSPVDLTGWRLDAGIDFLFTNGPVIPAGGFVVVARDATALRVKWPEVAALIVGDFSGKLSGGERCLLRDAAGNPVDETRVFEGGWSDGGGSSLELRDIDADHLNRDAWADSDESAKGLWQNVTYRMVAGQNYGSTRWNEFRIGLLDEGIVLIDDVSVVRDPDGVRQQLIQNGGFETTTGNTRWRFLGHHRGEFVPDPDNVANRVLRLSAEDRAVMNHNHVETTFLNNTTLTNGQLYEVSYRARWVAGSPQVNTRAYFSKLAKTTALAVPTRLGTPGAPNSQQVNNAGPTFTGLQHSPVVPAASQAVVISVRASDPDGVASATLNYRVNPATAFTSLAMTLQSTGAWTATIPGQTAGKIIHFYVTAADALGASAFAPVDGTNSRALYQVADGQGSPLPAHELRLIMLDADRDFMLNATNVMSNARIGATLIYDRTEVFYDAGAKLQGTVASRIRDGDNYVSYDVDFPPGRLFRGVQNNVGIDRSGRGPTVRAQDEIYILHMFHRAGIPVPYSDLCYFIAPRTVHTGTAILQLAGYGGGFVEEQYGEDGSVFNMDITYEPDTTTDGGVESIKLPNPHQAHIGTDFTDLGEMEQYRSPFDIRFGNRRDDYAGLMALCQVMGSPQVLFDAQISSVLDVDQALRMAAMEILCGIGDTYINSAAGQLPHNLRLITFPDGDPAQLLAWDMDFALNAAATSPILITSGSNLGKLMNHPATLRLYLHHINDLCQTSFNTDYMNPWLTHYASVVGQNYSAASGYISSRRAHALTQLPAVTPFAITSNGGNDFSASTNFITLAGTSWLDVRGIEVNGIPYVLNWTTVTNWSLILPLGAGANFLTVQAVDREGNRPANRIDTITVTNTVPPALVPVVINEWMADNAGPWGFADPSDGLFQDWFELFNPNASAVNLGGFYLTDNLANPTKYLIPSNTVITALGHLLVWADENGSQNSPTNADLHANFKLSNNGEAIGLFAPDGISPQHTVTFGAQFLNVSQGLFPDGAVGSVHFMTNWTPRAQNQLGLPPAPNVLGITSEPGAVHFTISSVAGRSYQMEFKDALDAPAWLPMGGPRTATGTSLVFDINIGPEPKRFFRFRLQ